MNNFNIILSIICILVLIVIGISCEKMTELLSEKGSITEEQLEELNTDLEESKFVFKTITDIYIPAGSRVEIEKLPTEDNSVTDDSARKKHFWIHYSVNGQSRSQKIEILKLE